MKTKYILLIITIFIIGCGSGGDSGSSNENNQNNITTSTGGTIQLGYIKGANVTISSLDGYVFQDDLTTNDNGKYFPNKGNIKKAIDEYNPSMKFLLITSKGGIDTDPDDNGIIVESEYIQVKGEVKAIISIEDFFNDKEHNINLITTAIADIIGDNTNISKEQIIKIAKEIGVEDIDNDGNITMNDLIYYNMVYNDSRAESYLRKNYLDNIHQNNKDKIKNFIKELKMNQSMIMPIIKHTSNSVDVEFKPLGSSNYIKYGIKFNSADVIYNFYNNESINLPINSVLYFKECDSNNECYKIQKVLYDGTNYYLDYLEYENPKELFSNKDELENLKNNVSEKKAKLEIIGQNLQTLKNELENINSKVSNGL